jgi:hypothetical protein
MNNINLYIIILIILLIYLSSYIEKFNHYVNPYFNPKIKYCSNCGDLDRYDCSECHNCGFCYPLRGAGSCVPGDHYGPLFREDCFSYEYNYPYYNVFDGIYKYPQFKFHHNYYNDYDIEKLKKKIEKLQQKVDKLKDKKK